MAGKDARHTRGDERRTGDDQHVKREHQGNRSQYIGTGEVSEEMCVYDSEQPIHSHHENDRQGRFDIYRAERPGQKCVCLEGFDPVSLPAFAAQFQEGARVSIRATDAEDKESRV